MPSIRASATEQRPTITDLGEDLLRISPFRRWVSVLSPFGWSTAFFVFALWDRWIPAMACLVALSFVTYGSVSHDLVHRNLGLPKRTNDLFLVLIELLALRSGTAYRLAHLHHHGHYPADDDVEGAAAKMGPIGALLEGIRFQAKLYRWAWRQYPRSRRKLGFEGILILLAYVASLLALPRTPIPLVYAVLMTMGAWIIPFITSYIPHNPDAEDSVHQTRAFRGKALSILAFEHLYHLEHHLYPSVPHHNWPKLARRLDPFLHAAGIRPIKLWF
jgi:beta-carotene hydroxylase